MAVTRGVTTDRQVFRLPDHSTGPNLPTWIRQAVASFGLSSPDTAAGPRRIPTGFPIKLEKHLSKLMISHFAAPVNDGLWIFYVICAVYTGKTGSL